MITPSEREAALLGMALGKPIAGREAGREALPLDIARGLEAGPTARWIRSPGVCQAIQQACRKNLLPRPVSPDFPS